MTFDKEALDENQIFAHHINIIFDDDTGTIQPQQCFGG